VPTTASAGSGLNLEYEPEFNGGSDRKTHDGTPSGRDSVIPGRGPMPIPAATALVALVVDRQHSTILCGISAGDNQSISLKATKS